MAETIDITITVRNKLKKEKREINVFHQGTRSTHIISHNSSVTLPLKTTTENDYLHISPIRGPGNLRNDCLINLPSWINLEFSMEGKAALTHSHDRTLLKIPPGPPTWQVKMTRSVGSPLKATVTGDHVTIDDS
jgi:hypothetical protein